MLRARALSSWTAGGGLCANPDLAPRSTGLHWPVGSTGWAMPAQHTVPFMSPVSVPCQLLAPRGTSTSRPADLASWVGCLVHEPGWVPCSGLAFRCCCRRSGHTHQGLVMVQCNNVACHLGDKCPSPRGDTSSLHAASLFCPFLCPILLSPKSRK